MGFDAQGQCGGYGPRRACRFRRLQCWTMACVDSDGAGQTALQVGGTGVADAAIIAELETRDTGKVIRETKAVTGYVAECYRYFAGLADKIEGARFPIDKPDLEVRPGVSPWALWRLLCRGIRRCF